MKRYIYIPGCEKWVTLKAYNQAIRCAKANPLVEFSYTLCGWWPGTGAEIMRQFRDGIQDRINQGISYTRRGLAAVKGANNDFCTR